MRLAALLVLIALSFSAAEAATVELSKVRSGSAVASFEHVDPTGCIFTSVGVIASDEVVRADDVTASSLAVVSVVRFDACTRETLVDAIGSVELLPSQFQLTPARLTGATLRAGVLMVDTTGSSPPADWTVEVVWEPAGPIETTRTRFHEAVSPPGGGGFLLSGSVKGLTRDALAHGRVSDGTTNFLEGVVSLFGFISEVKAGSILVD